MIGGNEAERNSLPWQAALGERDTSGTTEWFCGGSFIGKGGVQKYLLCNLVDFSIKV